MANKYLAWLNGVLTEVVALVTSAGAGDAGKIVALDSSGKLDSSVMPVGIGSESDSIPCTENLSAGDMVNIYTSVGAVKCRKADATTAGKEANGFVIASFTSGQTATVFRPSQSNTGVTGLTPGTTYYLSVTAGGVTATSPAASGNISQVVGKAVSATALSFDPQMPVTLA